MFTIHLRLLADFFEALGKSEMAGNLWMKIVAKDPSPLYLTAAGTFCFNKNNIEGAEKLFKAALTSDPKFYQAHFNMGFLKQKMLLHSCAIDYFSTAISLQQKCDVAFFGRAISHLANQSYQKAIADLKKTIILQPYGPHAYYHLCHTYSKLKKVKECLVLINQIKGFEPQIAHQLKRELNL
jgi:tetratricopeptide (TPR) repeat protein